MPNKLFDSIRFGRPKRNKFDLSQERKLSMNMGYLVPIMCEEVIPGDNFRVNTEVLVRLAPMLAPIMHRVNVRTEYFFVPNRLIWDEWEDFITGGRLGTSAPVAPKIVGPLADPANWDQWRKGSLADYFGLPVLQNVGDPSFNTEISALPFRAYQLIWDEYYRDQNVFPSLDISKASGAVDGDEAFKLMALRRRAWEKDYFTSALPWAQRGAQATGPVGIEYLDTSLIKQASGAPPSAGALTSNNPAGQLLSGGGAVDPSRVENIENANIQIEELRRAFKLQEWLEKNARGGARYIEQILSHFGVTSSDSRLQRPEYLGGGRTPVVVSEVVSTFQFDGGDIPQGNMAGHGISVGGMNGFKGKSFEEHGFIIGLVSVLPRTAYMQGREKLWTRFDKFDYFWPEFAHLGEQVVDDREIYFDMNGASDPEPGTFGYQSRYCEYKYRQDMVAGDFRDSLAYWHMARIFEAPPVLDLTFTLADPTHRIFAVTDPDEHKLYCQVYNSVSALRPMPYYGTPHL